MGQQQCMCWALAAAGVTRAYFCQPTERLENMRKAGEKENGRRRLEVSTILVKDKPSQPASKAGFAVKAQEFKLS